MAISNAGFNLEITKTSQRLAHHGHGFDFRKRWRVIVQAVKKLLLLFGDAFNRQGYAISRVCNPAILLVLPGKPNNKRTKSQPLDETFDFYF